MCNIEGKKQRERERERERENIFHDSCKWLFFVQSYFYLKGNKDEFVKNYEN